MRRRFFWLAALPLAVTVACGSSGQPATNVAASPSPTPSPTVSLSPLAQYRAWETKYDTIGSGSADDEAASVAANSCDNTLGDDKQFVSGIGIAYPEQAKHQMALVDHALLISAWCPNQRLEYDEAVHEVAPDVTLPGSTP